MLKLLRSKRGERYIAVAVSVLPVFVTKNKLDTYASELCREAEIAGCVGSETTLRAQVLTEQTGLAPSISWSKTGRLQLNQEFTVTVTTHVECVVLIECK